MERDEPLARFLTGRVDNRAFRHRDHLQVAFAILRLMPFADAAALYVRGLKAIASAAGAPEKYHETMTFAFLSLVAERLEGFSSFDAFLAANPELAHPSVLERWYQPARLYSDLARRTFLLPGAEA